MFTKHRVGWQGLFRAFVFGFLVAFTCDPAHAVILDLPRSIGESALSETTPLVFDPDLFTTKDYQVEWQGQAPAGVRLELVPESLEWIRVAEVFVVPRARLRVVATGVDGATIRNNRFTDPLVRDSSGNWSAEIPVAMISGPRNPIQLTLKRSGSALQTYNAELRFHPVVAKKRFYVDASCSPFRVDVDLQGPATDQWTMVSCRLAYTYANDVMVPSLEMYVFWDNVGTTIDVGGVATEAISDSAWALRLSSQPGQVTLHARDQQAVVSYHVPVRLHPLSLAAGLGPYDYTFRAPGNTTSQVAPFLTIYGSYFFTETLRVVAFDATALSKAFYTDFGVYLSNETFRALDDRFSMNLMLGAHMFAFNSDQGMQFPVGFPQGFEFIFRDAFKPRWNLASGGFVYPSINGTSYFNIWLRWGTRGYFAEINYLAWVLPTSIGQFSSRSLGLSFGFPVAQFF